MNTECRGADQFRPVCCPRGLLSPTPPFHTSPLPLNQVPQGQIVDRDTGTGETRRTTRPPKEIIVRVHPRMRGVADIRREYRWSLQKQLVQHAVETLSGFGQPSKHSAPCSCTASKTVCCWQSLETRLTVSATRQVQFVPACPHCPLDSVLYHIPCSNCAVLKKSG